MLDPQDPPKAPPGGPGCLHLFGCFPSLFLLLALAIKPVLDLLEDTYDRSFSEYSAPASLVGTVLGLILLSRLKSLPRMLFTALNVAGFMLLMAFVVTTPGFIRSRPQGQLTACKSNLKNLATAMEMYSTDHQGRYPMAMGDLTPNYLKTIPTCPSVRSVTYQFMAVSDPDLYTMVCCGGHHGRAGVPANYPQYTSVQGLIEKP